MLTIDERTLPEAGTEGLVLCSELGEELRVTLDAGNIRHYRHSRHLQFLRHLVVFIVAPAHHLSVQNKHLSQTVQSIYLPEALPI